MVTISGGAKLEAALREMSKNVTKAARVEVGFPVGSIEADGTSIPMIAAIQEFGAPKRNIPPRPYFRTMIAQHSDEWPDEIVALLKENNFDAEAALADIGKTIAGELAQSIRDLMAPPLSPVTIMLRGMRSQAKYRDKPFGELIVEAVDRVAKGKSNYGASTKPLIDSGDMVKAIKFDVK